MPPFLSTSHCEFYGAHCVTTRDKPSTHPIHSLIRELIPSFTETGWQSEGSVAER